MTWNGIGFTGGIVRPGVPGAAVPPTITNLQPSLLWTGAAGSGFVTTPVDPVRITAKPALRLITPPFQWFTQTLDVGVIAAANDAGSLFDTLGIAKITFYYEGSEANVEAPSWHTIQTLRGPRSYYGWWARLKKPVGTAGHAHLYVEATARDGTMQKRVMGPYTFSPQDTLYDAELTITPSLAEVVGERYQSLPAAIAWVKANSKVNPLLTITEAGTYNFGTTAGELYDNPGYVNVTASVPVTIGRNAGDYVVGGANLLNNDRAKLRLFGQNITLDFRYALTFLHSAAVPAVASTFRPWLDGITMTNTDPAGNESSTNGEGISRAGLGRIFAAGPWMTEVNVSDLMVPMIDCPLIRGCLAEDLAADVANFSSCIIQSRFLRNDNSFWNDDRPAFSVAYAGAEATATIARSGQVLGNNGGVWTVTLGATSYTFNTGRISNGFVGADGKYFTDLVAWLNTLPDVTATLLIEPFDRVASGGSLPGFVGQGFGATSFKDAGLTVTSHNDIHADFYQHQGGTDLQNAIIAFNEVIEYQAQIMFLSPPNPAPRGEFDVVIFGNVFHASDDAASASSDAAGGSQWGRPNLPLTCSHVVWAHNTFPNQKLIIRSEGGGLATDAYCLMVNNTFPELQILGTAPVPNLTINGLHLHAEALAPPSAVHVTIAGNETSLFNDAKNFDFSPAGALLVNLRTAAMPVDQKRAVFPNTAPTGALT